jgi:hypothetical protein
VKRDHHAGSLAREGDRGGAPDPSTPSGDDDDSICKSQFHGDNVRRAPTRGLGDAAVANIAQAARVGAG